MKTTLTSNLPIEIERLSKEEITALSERISSAVSDGLEDSGKLYIKLDFLKRAIDGAIKTIKEDASTELKKYDKGQTLMGVEFNITETGKASYDHNPIWVEAKLQLTAIEEDMKIASKTNSTVVDDETGEVVPPARYTYSERITPKYPK